MHNRWSLALTSVIIALISGFVISAELPIDKYREHHERILQNIELTEDKLALFGELDPAELHRQMREVVAFFQQEIRPHAEKEQAVLYPVVDREANGKRSFTATMRYEHSLVDAWIELLVRETKSDNPDQQRFIRIAYNLTGVLKSHVEKEENVLLPILDRTMTQEEFREEVLSRMESGR